MEKKYKRIPFDLELAKAITKGEKEGRVVTRDSRKARVVCWDKAGKLFPIVALLADTQFNESTAYYTEKGKRAYPGTRDCDDDLFLEVPDKFNLNEVDVETFGDVRGELIGICKKNETHYYVVYNVAKNSLCFDKSFTLCLNYTIPSSRRACEHFEKKEL